MPLLALEMEYHFAAAHRLPRYRGKCFDMHGHNYKLVVSIRGEPDPYTGILVDFGDLEQVVQDAVLERCDHHTLNDFIENPTAENIVVWMWEQLAPKLPGLAELRLWETKDCSVVYRGEA